MSQLLTLMMILNLKRFATYTELRVAAACLICFWCQHEEHITHWLIDSLTDVVLRLSPQGAGADYLVKKFCCLFACRAESNLNSDN